jgi:hypothetical protein
MVMSVAENSHACGECKLAAPGPAFPKRSAFLWKREIKEDTDGARTIPIRVIPCLSVAKIPTCAPVRARAGAACFHRAAIRNQQSAIDEESFTIRSWHVHGGVV